MHAVAADASQHLSYGFAAVSAAALEALQDMLALQVRVTNPCLRAFLFNFMLGYSSVSSPQRLTSLEVLT